MSIESLKVIYSERHSAFTTRLDRTRRQINAISNLRLIAALLALVAFYFSFINPYAAGGVLLAVALFFYLVKRHAKLFEEKVHLENLVNINAKELKALEGNTSSFESGRDFIDPAHPYTHDLDIFGEGSLYQYVNRANTISGKRKFARHLEHPFEDKSEILSQQSSIRDLKSRIDFRQHIQAAGMEIAEQPSDYHQLILWTRQLSLFRRPESLRILLWVIPAVTLLALAASFFFPKAKLLLILFILLQWIITGSKLKKINVFHDYISRKKNILEKYSRLLFYIEHERFQSPRLTELSTQANEAHSKVRHLASLVSALDARTNSMATFIVNSLLLYDLQCVYRLEKWKEKNSDKLALWLDTITEIESLNSFATFAFNHPDFPFAEINDELKIEGKGIAHPLISPSESVRNDITLGQHPSVLIITGANMAGKSTFLRTLGVNIVLALNGAPVCASSFSCPILHLRSGMRTADSLKDHQSYFFAELHRLRSIMDELRSERPLLILLDEILKGTNSNDKEAGSIALVRQLLPHPCLAVIATHDLALGDLEKAYPDKVNNYCFEANIENDQLTFDYKLNRGIAQKMNASFLMKKMGIIP